MTTTGVSGPNGKTVAVASEHSDDPEAEGLDPPIVTVATEPEAEGLDPPAVTVAEVAQAGTGPQEVGVWVTTMGVSGPNGNIVATTADGPSELAPPTVSVSTTPEAGDPSSPP